jgi:hypothetical protein
VSNGKLTRYQLDAVTAGVAADLIFDEYTILEKIGQGGWGPFFEPSKA